MLIVLNYQFSLIKCILHQICLPEEDFQYELTTQIAFEDKIPNNAESTYAGPHKRIIRVKYQCRHTKRRNRFAACGAYNL